MKRESGRVGKGLIERSRRAGKGGNGDGVEEDGRRGKNGRKRNVLELLSGCYCFSHFIVYNNTECGFVFEVKANESESPTTRFSDEELISQIR